MTALELIKHLKRLPETANIYLDDHEGGLIPVGGVRPASRKDKIKAGRSAEKEAIVITGFGN